MEMLLSDVKKLLSSMIDSGVVDINLCLEGHQGIGKTQIIKQVAKEKGWHYCAIYCAQTSTEDLIGMPKIVADGKGGFVTEFAKPKLFPTEENTLFVLEEINRAPLEVQQSVLQLLTDKKLGNFVLPKNTIICACINPTEGMYQTLELDSVFVNRLVKIQVSTSPKEFISYATANKFDEDIINFIGSLNKKEASIYFAQVPDKDNIGKPIPSPRTWEIVNNILKMNLPDASLLTMISGAIGQQAATKFLSTRRQLKNLVKIDDLLNNFDSVKSKLDNLEDGEMYKLVNDLSEKLIHINDIDEYTGVYKDGVKSLGDFIVYLIDKNKAIVSVFLSAIDPIQHKTVPEIITAYETLTKIPLLEKIANVISTESGDDK